MENIFKEIVSQIPALGVLCFIVATFIRHMDKRDKLVVQMHEESMSERRESRAVIRENATATSVNTNALNNLAHVISIQTERK